MIDPTTTQAATLRAAANGDPDACAWLRCLAPDLEVDPPGVLSSLRIVITIEEDGMRTTELTEAGVVNLLAAVVRQAAIDADRATGHHQDTARSLLRDWDIDPTRVRVRAPQGERLQERSA